MANTNGHGSVGTMVLLDSRTGEASMKRLDAKGAEARRGLPLPKRALVGVLVLPAVLGIASACGPDPELDPSVDAGDASPDDASDDRSTADDGDDDAGDDSDASDGTDARADAGDDHDGGDDAGDDTDAGDDSTGVLLGEA